jgi:hypothetical protein
MSDAWLRRARKLRRMSPREVGFRLREAWRIQRCRRRVAVGVAQAKSSLGHELSQNCLALIPGAHAPARTAWQAADPVGFAAQAERAQARALELLAGRWDALGQSFQLTPTIDWHCDPVSGFRWPVSFFADVPLYDLHGTDVKHVWEIGRQQYVVDLALHAWFSGDSTAAQRALDFIQSWVLGNPAYRGVHWTSGLEVAMRSLSWIWALALISGSNAPEAVRAADGLANTLAEHADYLSQFPSIYSSPYNHLIGEATALLWIACVLPSHPRSKQWQREAQKVLAEHAPRQFYADGFSVEQAAGYHAYTLGFLVQARVALASQGQTTAALDEVILRAARVYRSFQQPDGQWPPLGDVDSARSIPLVPDRFWDFSDLVEVAAVISGAKTDYESGGLACRFLISQAKVNSSLPCAESAGCVLLESGYAISPGGHPSGDWLLFRSGPLGAGLHADSTPSVAHGHADALHLIWWQAGRPILIDSGMESYAGPRKSLDLFRDPCGHNTLEIEGLPIAREAGRLAWSHVVSRISLEACIAREVWISKGSVALTAETTIERYVLALPGQGLWIADRIRGARHRRLLWYWQLATKPAHTWTAEIAQLEWPHAFFTTQATSAWTGFRYSSSEDDPPIVYAPEYGRYQPGHRCSLELIAEDDTLALTQLAPTPLQASFQITGRRIGSRELAGAIDLPCEATSPCEATWHVQTPECEWDIAVGVDVNALPDGMHRVEGVGGWPVALRTRVLTSSAKATSAPESWR